jgi:hypothetical protein
VIDVGSVGCPECKAKPGEACDWAGASAVPRAAHKARYAAAGQKQTLTDLTCVAYFLLGARGEMHNGHTGEEALKAFCRMTEIDEASLILKTKGFIR